MSPRVIRIAAADLFGNTAGDIVNSASNADTGRMKLFVFFREVWMEVMASDDDVKESACEMICFSFACADEKELRTRRQLGLAPQTQAS